MVCYIYGVTIPFFRTSTYEFDKNANSIYVGVIKPFCINLCSNNRGLRFLCVGFGWRTFLFLERYMFSYRVSFFGHRTLYSLHGLDDKIENIAVELIRKYEFVEFYVGRNGDFDIIAASAIKRAQRRMGKERSALILTLPYVVKDIEYYEKFYDEIIIPTEGKQHFKTAITKRNEWMIDNSDLVIACVQNESGGAYNAIKYAQSRKVKVLNIGEDRITMILN